MIPITRVSALLVPVGRPTLPRDPRRAFVGAFGAVWMDRHCDAGQPPSCRDCRRVAGCPIPTWFNPGRAGSDAPRPYALREVRPFAAGSLLVRMSWFGAVPGAEVLDALQAAAGRMGRSRDATWTLATVLVNGVAVVDHGRRGQAWPVPEDPLAGWPLARPVGGARIRLESPLQLDKEASRPSLGALLRACLLRVRSLQRGLGLPSAPRWPDPPEDLRGLVELAPVRVARPSRHEGQHVDLSGWTGELLAGPEIAPWAELLALGEQFQIGRHTAEGLGAIRVDWL